MYGRQRLNDLPLLTCPKCGAPQESPGSTVCELCGANLPHPRVEDWAGKLLASWEAELQPQRPTAQSAASLQNLAPAHFEATQAVMISSVPRGATVRLNAREMGKTPMTLKLAPGTYRVTISRTGYATVSRTITVERGKAASLGVSLPRKGPPPVQPVPPSRQSRDTKKYNHKLDGEP